MLPMTSTAPNLSHSLLQAAEAHAAVLQGQALPDAIAWLTHSGPERGAMQDLAYHAMRQHGTTNALVKALSHRPVRPPLLHSLLCVSLSLLLPVEDGPTYDSFTVVDQAVEAAQSHPELRAAKGMVNAVLRNFLREQTNLLAKVMALPEARWNYPAWWVETVRDTYPEQWETILQAGNQKPPLTLRVNQRQSTVAQYLDRLNSAGIAAEQIGLSAVRLAQPIPVAKIPGFEEGMVSVQDAGAQLAAQLLNVQAGQRVLDACAAPGGKTGHLLEMADIELLALEYDHDRLDLITENLQRLKLAALVLGGDANKPNHWWDGVQFDAILADVPCTASGIVRRHPDIRWLRHRGDARQLAGQQSHVCDALWPLLKPGGKLLYATCSIFTEESSLQAQQWLKRHSDAQLLTPMLQLLPGVTMAPIPNMKSLPLPQDHDGFFYALFEKRA